jgi:hypothetical protein
VLGWDTDAGGNVEYQYASYYVEWQIRLQARSPRRVGMRKSMEGPNFSFRRMAIFADPFGHGFCLIEFQGRGYDEIGGATVSVQLKLKYYSQYFERETSREKPWSMELAASVVDEGKEE